MIKFGILGVGKMGGAILQGLLDSSLYTKDEILLCIRNVKQKEELEKEGFTVTLDYDYFFNNVEVIMLAIKPQGFDDMMIIASKYDYSSKAIISIAAGITISYLERYFINATVIRVMPNTPSLIKQGVSTVACKVNNKYVDLTMKIFSSIGKAYIVDEELLDTALPLNGSLPAYLFYFAKAFIDQATTKYNIDYDVAKKLCAESIISSSLLMLQSDDDLQTLINNVCSKGGTTIQGLNQLIEGEVDKSIAKCYDACVKRSKELAK